MLFPAVVLVMPMTEPPVEREPPAVEASVGKGGNDLAARLAIESSAAMRPSLTVENYTFVGEDATVLVSTSTMLRAQPMLVAGITPEPEVELFAGVGVGAARIYDAAGGVSSAFTYMAQVGVRIDDAGAPIVISAGGDAVQSHGMYVGVCLALETAP